MQTLFEVHYPSLDIQILGVNEFGQDSANALMTAEGDLPWLQDTDTDNNQISDVWDETWENVTYRDVQIVDKNGDVTDIYNVTQNNLAETTNFNALRDLFVAQAASPAASNWQSPIEPLDVNRDGLVAPIDALIAINGLNSGDAGPLAGTSVGPDDPLVDVTGDGQLSALDPLFVINHLNRDAPPPQAALSSVVAENSSPVDVVFASYTDSDTDEDDDDA